MQFVKTDLEGVFIIKPKVFGDSRGQFVKTFHEQTFREKGLACDFKESFYSTSSRDVIRGMHFSVSSPRPCKISLCNIWQNS